MHIIPIILIFLAYTLIFPLNLVTPGTPRNKKNVRNTCRLNVHPSFPWCFGEAFPFLPLGLGLDWSQELRDKETKMLPSMHYYFCLSRFYYEILYFIYSRKKCANVPQNIGWLTCWCHSWSKMPMLFFVYFCFLFLFFFIFLE